MSMFDQIRNTVRGGARGPAPVSRGVARQNFADRIMGQVRGVAQGAVSVRRGSAAPTIGRNSGAGRAATGLTSYFQEAYRTGNHARPPLTLRRK